MLISGPSWTTVVAANSYSMALKSDNTLWAWGLGSSGQLGTLTETKSWIELSAGNSTSLAIRSDNTLWGWGLNTSFQIGNGASVTQSSPVQVGSSLSWIKVSSGNNHGLAITNAGELYGWGTNAQGQVGDNTSVNRSLPTLVDSSGSWSTVSAGNSFSLGIKASKAYGWGINNLGQTGTNSKLASISSPTQIGTGSWNIVSTSETGNFAGGIDSNNKLFMWGSGNNQTARAAALQFSWAQIAFGYSHTVALKDDGTLWTWGDGDDGRLGDNSVITKSSPVQIGTSSWLYVSAGSNQSYAIRLDGTLWAWGKNTVSGALGDNSIINKSSPVLVTGGFSWSMVASGTNEQAFGITSTGSLYSWGQGILGALGNGTTINRSNPTIISSAVSWKSVASAGGGGVALKTDGTLWTWGDNRNGLLGNNTTISRSSPIQVTGTWSTATTAGSSGPYANIVALRSDGTLWIWGQSTANLSGIGTGTGIAGQRSSPVQIGTRSDWIDVVARWEHLYAVDTSNVFYGWGTNSYGEVGDGTVIQRSTPTVIPAPVGRSWKYLPKGNNGSHNNDGQTGAFGIFTENSELYVWGNQRSTGLNETTPARRSDPVQLSGSWVQLINPYAYDSTLWSTLPTFQSSPVQIGNSSWTQLSVGSSHSLAIRGDGTLWSWGTNTNGQLGLGDTVTRSSPSQIGTDTNWLSVSAGLDHSMAIKRQIIFGPTFQNYDSLWGWGDNSLGQLGDGTTINTLSPIQIGTSSWSQVNAGTQFTLARDINNNLYAWGQDSSGQLGF